MPAKWAEPWDNVGLTVGDASAEISRVLVALDVTWETVAEARGAECQMLLTHHPFPWKERRRFDWQDPDVPLLAAVLEPPLQLFAVHTNLDASPRGHAASIARSLSLADIRPLRRAVEEDPTVGLGRYGLIAPTTLGGLIEALIEICGLSAVAVAGSLAQPIGKVAICPGSAGDLIPDAFAARADVLVGGEFSHHQALAAQAGGLALVDTGHYALEKPAVPILADLCREILGDAGIEILIAGCQSDPFRYLPAGSLEERRKMQPDAKTGKGVEMHG